MSGFLFLLVINWIMRKTTTANNNTGIRWKMTTKLDDLDFADDITLLSSSKDHMQNKFNSLNNYATQTGLKINAVDNSNLMSKLSLLKNKSTSSSSSPQNVSCSVNGISLKMPT